MSSCGITFCPLLLRAAANLLLDITAQHIKLADFGAAELLEEKRLPSDRIHIDTCGGTLHYNPPEVCPPSVGGGGDLQV